MAKLKTKKADISAIMRDIKLLVIGAVGRSGSVFVQSLFDAHPQIIGLPTLHGRYDYYTQFLSLNKSIKEFYYAHEFLFDHNKNYFSSPGLIPLKAKVINPKILFKHFENLQALWVINNRKDFLVILHLAWALALKQDINKLKYISFHYHSPSLYEDLKFILEDFEGVKFCITLRDPLESAYTWKLFLKNNMPDDYRNYYLHLLAIATSTIRLFEIERAIQKHKEEHLMLIDLNDLHKYKDKALVKICDWLGIKFNKILLKSTIMGAKWLGNSADRRKISSFSKDKIKLKYPSFIDTANGLSSKDLKLCHYIYNGVFEAFGYEPYYKTSTSLYEATIIVMRNIKPAKPSLKITTDYRYVWKKTFSNIKYISALPLFISRPLYFVFKVIKDNILRNAIEIIHYIRKVFYSPWLSFLIVKFRTKFTNLSSFRLYG